MKDYYDTLGVSRGADQEEIRSAYRRLARLHHPDVSEEDGDKGDRFKEISQAYEVLGDPERRRRYDMFGDEGASASPFGDAMGGFGNPFGDIFNIFFGRGQARSPHAPRRGSDLLAVMELTLAEAYAGTSREIELPRHETCVECGGTGLEKGYGHDLCPDCGGEGRSVHTRRSAFGTLSSTTTCRRCGGSGEINTHPCPACEGQGATRIADKIEVNIPAGVDDGDRVRLAGRGEAGHMGGPSGDLYVEIRVGEHETFTRHGKDLHALVSVNISEAALGTDIEVPTLNSEERLHIPAGSQPGEVFRLRGKGMPGVRSRGNGDMYLTLEVRVPKKLNTEQKKLMKEFQRIESEKKDSFGIVGRLRKAIRQDY
jgi:molecular chaperone DnaJ